MSDLNIGVAHISIEPMASSFQAQAEQKIKQALAPIRPNVNIQANLNQASIQKAITQVKAELKALSNGNNVVINGNIGPLQAKLAALAAQVAAVNSAMAKGGGSGFLGQASIAAATNDLGKMDDRLKQLNQDLADGGSTGTAAFHAISAAISSAEQRLSDLKFNGVINADDVQQVTNLDKGLRTLEGTVMSAGEATSHAGGQARGLFSAFAKIASVSIPLFAKSMDDVSGSVIPGFGSVLMGVLPHMLSYASGVHMMLEAVIEFTAVWAPALVAISAFALAAAPEAYAVYKQLDSMNTVAKATGQTFADFPKLTGALTNALKPQLLELYGIALQGVDSSSGKLGPALDVVAKGVDNVAARIVAWTQNSSGGLEKFIESGAQDAGLLADAFVQLGRTLGTILQSVPGYAKMLLEFGDACLTVLADVTKFLQPAIALFLKLHGAIFYLGLATTLVASFGTAFLSAMVAVATGSVVEETTGKFAAMGSALGSLVGKLGATAAAAYTYGASLTALAGEEGIAAAASKGFADLADAIPFGPEGVLAAGLAAVIGGGLYLAFRKTTDATDAFISAQNKMVAASDVVDLQVNIANAIAALAAPISTANAAIAKYNTAQAQSVKNGTAAANASGFGSAKMIALTRAADGASESLMKLTPAQAALNEQLDTSAIRLPALATQFGSVTSVMGLMNLAGVSASGIATDTNSQFTQMIIKLTGVAEGYGLMTTQAGAAGNQLNAMNISTSSAYKAVQTLTSAESAWLSLVTGGTTDLESFVSGQTSLGKATSGTTQNTIAGRAAFSAQVNAAGTLLGSLQSLSSASGNTAKSQGEVTSAMKSAIGQMLPFAKGSATNTAELSSLAQMVGGPATDNFQTLSKWVGNTSDSQKNLAKQTDALTISSSNLSSAAKNLASTLSADITAGQAAAVMQNGLTSATNAFGKAMDSSNGTLSTSVKTTGVDYYNALVKAGVGTSQATQYVDAFMKQQGFTQSAINSMNTYLDQQAKKLTNVKTQAQQAQGALSNYAKGGPYNAKVTTTVGADGVVQVKGAGPGLNDVLAHLSFAGSSGNAAGGVMTMPGASSSVTGDNMIASVKSGELIIPSQHAPKFADMARTSGIKGFAGGGTIGSLNSSAVSAVNNTDQQGMQSGSQQVMAQAVKDMTSYMKSQSSAGGTPVHYSPTAGVNQWKSIVLQALAMNGEPASLLNQVLYQMMTESGGNPNAQNNTDSNAAAGDPSRGLLQTIGSTFSAYHIAGTSENIFNPLANVAAAINYAKHVYGPSLMSGGMGMGSGHGYSAGGVTPEKILGFGVSTGSPYAFGSGEQVSPAGQANASNSSGLPGMNMYQANTMIGLLDTLVKVTRQAPQGYANGLNGAVNGGVQRAFFQTGG